MYVGFNARYMCLIAVHICLFNYFMLFLCAHTGGAQQGVLSTWASMLEQILATVHFSEEKVYANRVACLAYFFLCSF